MRANVMEVVVGGIVLLVAALFLAFAYSSSQWRGSSGTPLVAIFDRVDGLSIGSDVRVGGVKVGTVTHFSLTPQFLARVELNIDREVALPVDSSAEIVSDGLLGAKYLSLMPGVKEKNMEPGAQIKKTKSGMNLETLLSRFLLPSKAKEENPKPLN